MSGFRHVFQDTSMKSVYSAFPEILFMDATAGQSEIVAVWVTANETEHAIEEMISCFQNHNPDWKKTSLIMTDKDMTEHKVLRGKFPQANLLLCLFHTLRSFRREITLEKMKITAGQKEFALELISKMVYSKNEEEYQRFYQDLDQDHLTSVKAYFDANWHGIRNEWVEGLKGEEFTLGESTNNRIESINQKIKSVCSVHSNMNSFFEQFLAFLSVMRNERDHASLMAVAKRRVVADNSEESSFAKYLTPFAFSRIVKQLRLYHKVELHVVHSGLLQVLSSGQLLEVNPQENRCSCVFNTTMRLPCRHLLAARVMLGRPLFSKDGIAQRWTVDYMKEYLHQKSSGQFDSAYQICSIDESDQDRQFTILNSHEKYRRANKIARKIPELCAEVGMTEYRERVEFLKSVVALWAKGERLHY
eukprot:m.215599 g.215599  ORF g.215599 m.215599 type:complete len:418 (+) comp39835_c0_seq7:476-1729(+)